MRKLTFLLACLFLVGVGLVNAQSKSISGKVLSADDGQPIIGATVKVKGASIGTVTNAEGVFKISVPESAKTLVISYVGMKTVEIEAKSNQSVSMIADSRQIDEVVVTAFGIKRNPRELGVSTAKVSDKELTQAGVSNVMNGLSGKVSGLQINTINNGVNPDTKITLRGNRHFLASNQALIVLDGAPVSATYLNSINPNDIENVNVLKGASAAALYGNDASNGVLIITTKQGSKLKPIVNVSNTTTFERISYLPNLQTRFGSGSGESVEGNDNNYTMWIGPDRNTDPYTSYENQSFGPEYNGQMVILGGKLVDGSYQMVPYSPIKNQKSNFFNTGISSQNDISYSAGDENSHFYLSGQDVNTTGTIPGDKNRRSGVRLSSGKKYGIFSADFTVGFTQTNTNISGGDMYQNRGVYWNVLNTPAHVPLTQYKDIVNNKFAALDGYFNAYYPNPYWQIAHSRQIDQKNNLLGSISLNLKPTKWLEFTNRTGVTFESENYNTYKDLAVYSAYSKSDPWGGGHMGVSSPYSGNSYYYMGSTMNLSNDFLATISKDFDELSTKLILGSSLASSKVSAISDGASALVIPNFYNISNRVGEASVAQSTIERSSIGAFGDVTVGYKKYIFLHASARNDWDSRLVANNRSFFYPAVDASLIISDIVPSIKESTPFSYLKVRGGWSRTGQISLANWYATLPSYVAGAGFPYGSTAGFRLSTALSNPTLKPEMTDEVAAGVEMSFVDSRIHLNVDYYKSNTKDQTIPASISSATGYTSAYINAGEMENRGLETELKFTPLLNLGGVVWNMNINYTYQTNKVLSIYPGLNELPINDGTAYGIARSVSYAVVGQEFPTLKVTDVQRDPQGHIIVDAITGLPTKDSKTVIAGHGNPNHILGIVNNFSYKGLSLNVVLEYRGGNKILNDVGSALDFTGISEHSALNGRQPFVIPNSVVKNSDGTYTPNTDVLVTDAGRSFWNTSDYYNVQSTYLTSAAFWKLREVAISYDVPVGKIPALKFLTAAKLGLVGRNLLMWRPATNVWTDPEFNSNATTSNAVGFTDEDQTPPTRVYGFTVKLTF
jgi:TonB-linked SusC/RagA family outer membrane protein